MDRNSSLTNIQNAVFKNADNGSFATSHPIIHVHSNNAQINLNVLGVNLDRLEGAAIPSNLNNVEAFAATLLNASPNLARLSRAAATNRSGSEDRLISALRSIAADEKHPQANFLASTLSASEQKDSLVLALKKVSGLPSGGEKKSSKVESLRDFKNKIDELTNSKNLSPALNMCAAWVAEKMLNPDFLDNAKNVDDVLRKVRVLASSEPILSKLILQAGRSTAKKSELCKALAVINQKEHKADTATVTSNEKPATPLNVQPGEGTASNVSAKLEDTLRPSARNEAKSLAKNTLKAVQHKVEVAAHSLLNLLKKASGHIKKSFNTVNHSHWGRKAVAAFQPIKLPLKVAAVAGLVAESVYAYRQFGSLYDGAASMVQVPLTTFKVMGIFTTDLSTWLNYGFTAASVGGICVLGRYAYKGLQSAKYQFLSKERHSDISSTTQTTPLSSTATVGTKVVTPEEALKAVADAIDISSEPAVAASSAIFKDVLERNPRLVELGDGINKRTASLSDAPNGAELEALRNQVNDFDTELRKVYGSAQYDSAAILSEIRKMKTQN